jgi:hypothetical protein
LKVIYNKESLTFKVNRKLDPLMKLLEMAVENFGLKEMGVENCRLRAYNVVNGIM